MFWISKKGFSLFNFFFTFQIELTLDLRNSTQHSSDSKQCDEIIYRCLSSLENLKSLSVFVNKYSIKNLEASKFTSSVFHMNKCKKLRYENETRDNNNNLLVLMLQSLPNLNVIKLACDYDEDILMQLPLMTKLKYLQLADYHQGLLKTIKCTETLEGISLKYCKNIVILIIFK